MVLLVADRRGEMAQEAQRELPFGRNLPRLLREELAAETHVLTEDNLLVVP